MENRLLNESFIRQRSDELQIPFDNLLAAAVLEEIVRRIVESDYRDVFWLKSSTGLKLENYRKKVDLTLVYYINTMQKFHYNKEGISNVLDQIFRNLKRETIHWSYDIANEQEIFYVYVVAAFSNMNIPVKLKLECVTDDSLVPDKKDIRLFSNNNQKIRIRCFPYEYLITEKFLDIMEKLELINDLSAYMDIFVILKKEAVSGRKVWELLSEGCKERGIRIEEQRYELLVSYSTNNYMKKKWKAYLRHEKKKSPEWDEVICLLDDFFSNIWMSMCRNVIYLGDWMPELGRYID